MSGMEVSKQGFRFDSEELAHGDELLLSETLDCVILIVDLEASLELIRRKLWSDRNGHRYILRFGNLYLWLLLTVTIDAFLWKMESAP